MAASSMFGTVMIGTDFTRTIERQARRLAKGALIVAWIVVLVSLGVLAASGRASEAVLGLFESSQYDFYLGRGPGDPPPSEYLANYLRRYDNPPPLEAFLDGMFGMPSWSERNIGSHFRARLPEEPEANYEALRSRWLTEQYDALFRRVDWTLRGLVADTAVNVDGLLVARPRVPPVFETESASPDARQATAAEIALPRVVAAWIKDERIRVEQARARDALVESFFLLMVLGAFGSVIFLSKDFIEREEQTPLAAYLFRPVLGMFLAVAVFILDIVAHSILSTASVLETRHETLYLLALAAGLLSEQAYGVVSIRANAALDSLRSRSDSPGADAESKQVT